MQKIVSFLSATVVLKSCSCRNKEHTMEKFQQVLDSIGAQPKASPSNNKKRKWREIEQLKEKFQLEKELKAYDDSLESMLKEF
ncbi:MAG: hypothetical protein ACI92O_002656 [Colwellia sp.]|jgi:hypothetical protein